MFDKVLFKHLRELEAKQRLKYKLTTPNNTIPKINNKPTLENRVFYCAFLG